MTHRMQTEAERRINQSMEALAEACVRSERGYGQFIRAYTFSDGSKIEVRQLSGRCAFSASGWRLGDSK